MLLIRAVIGGMRARRFGRIVNITSAMVKSPHPLMGLSTAARSALTAVCKGLSREVAADNVTINNLLPERIDTDRQRFMAELRSAMGGITLEEAYAEMAASIAAGRLGHAGGIRRRVRLSLQRARGLRVGAEPAVGRRVVRGIDLTPCPA